MADNTATMIALGAAGVATLQTVMYALPYRNVYQYVQGKAYQWMTSKSIDLNTDNIATVPLNVLYKCNEKYTRSPTINLDEFLGEAVMRLGINAYIFTNNTMMTFDDKPIKLSDLVNTQKITVNGTRIIDQVTQLGLMSKPVDPHRTVVMTVSKDAIAFTYGTDSNGFRVCSTSENYGGWNLDDHTFLGKFYITLPNPIGGKNRKPSENDAQPVTTSNEAMPVTTSNKLTTSPFGAYGLPVLGLAVLGVTAYVLSRD